MIVPKADTVGACLAKATDCARLARAAPNGEARRFWLRVRERWLHLAEQYRQLEVVDEFFGEASGPSKPGRDRRLWCLQRLAPA
jgi:hypothetical protein